MPLRPRRPRCLAAAVLPLLLAAHSASAAGPTTAPAPAACPRVVDVEPAGLMWRWVEPRPTGAAILSLWGAAADDLWAVGEGATVLHWNGVKWTPWVVPPTVTGRALWSVHGRSACDVWVVGEHGAAVHFDGRAWRVTPTGTEADLAGVWIAPTGERWAVGQNVVLRGAAATATAMGAAAATGAGLAWSVVSGSWPSLGAVAGSSARDVWAVGRRGAIRHFDGAAWSEVDNPRLADLGAIVVTSPSEVWVAAESGEVMRRLPWIDVKWGVVIDGAEAPLLERAAKEPVRPRVPPHAALWVRTPGDVLVARYGRLHRTGPDGASSAGLTGPEAKRATVGVSALFGLSPETTWMGGRDGALARLEGERAGVDGLPPSPTHASRLRAQLFWHGVGGALWAAERGGRVARFDGTRWVRESLPGLGDLNPVNTAWAAASTVSGGNEVWFGGEGLGRWDGHAFTRMRAPWRSPWVTGLWGSSPRDVWAVGAGVAHFDGKRWRAVKVPRRARRDAPETAYGAVWGSGPNDVWVASDLGEVLHFDGKRWRRDQSDSPHALRALWGSGPSDVWAVGDYGALIHFDGSAWRKQEVPAGTLNVIWGSGPGDVWAAGEAHWLLHYNGASWSRVDAPVSGCTALLGGGPAPRSPRSDAVWLGCAAGILHYSPNPLAPQAAP